MPFHVISHRSPQRGSGGLPGWIPGCLSALALMLGAIMLGAGGAGPALAVPLTLNFNEYNLPGTSKSSSGAGIRFTNDNHLTYGFLAPYIILGDNGWSSSISFDATPDMALDVESIDLLSGMSDIYDVARDPAAIFPEDQMRDVYATAPLLIHDNVIFAGYRNGAEVAHETLRYVSDTPLTHMLSDAFTGLDSFVISLDYAGATWSSPQFVGDRLRFCGYFCGTLRFDDLALDVAPAQITSQDDQDKQDVDPVVAPLPGAGVLLMLGLVVLAGFRARNRSFA